MTNQNTEHWTKQLYFYFAVGLSILFLSFGTFGLLYSNLTKFVFTKIDTGYVYIEGCNERTGKPQPVYNEVTSPSPKDKQEGKLIYTAKECKDLMEEEKDIKYQQEMLSSVLTVIISAIVLTVHLKYFKLK